MTTQHTPGPWQWNGSCLQPTEQSGIVTTIATEDGVMVSRGHPLESMERELSANKALIAAAPDLLATLRNIATADPRKWDVETRDQFQQWAQNIANHAIAKAEGGAA